MGLVDVMVGVLAYDYDFDGVEGGMSRPVLSNHRLAFAWLLGDGKKGERTMNTRLVREGRFSCQPRARVLGSA